MAEQEKYLITSSLLDSWHYLMSNEYAKMEDFMLTLRREKTPTTETQQQGFEFETWAEHNIDKTKNGTFQVRLSKDFTSASGQKYLLYGILDCLKGGVIYDFKHKKQYECGDFYNRCQTSMYFELANECDEFDYIIGTSKPAYQVELESEDGALHSPYNLYEEKYLRKDVRPIGDIISEFEDWLKSHDLVELYHTYWKAKN